MTYPSPGLHHYHVMNVCEKAVAFAPEARNIRDSCGLAKALTGDSQTAIKDFQFAIEQSNDEDFKKTRRAWITALERGDSPFTDKVLRDEVPRKMREE